MKYSLLSIALFLFCISCSDSEMPVDQDYRLAFVGTYDCTSSNGGPFQGPDVELEIKIDDTSNNQIVVAQDTVPISVDGTYGPDELKPGYYYELRIDDNGLYLYTYYVTIFGISLPMEFECERQ